MMNNLENARRRVRRECATFLENARRRLRNGERGGILLEFGLMAPLLVTLILGGITTGLAYDTNNNLNNGARESARFAATLPVDGATGMATWLNAVADAAIASAGGQMDATVADQEVCVAYVHPDGTAAGDQTASLTETAGTRIIANGATCFDDGRPDSERRVQVVLSRSADIEAVVVSRTVGIEARSVARFERAEV